jgi:putative component of membrane protein insertase Oxa1/YidC/SpoIIIJ protein YidD
MRVRAPAIRFTFTFTLMLTLVAAADARADDAARAHRRSAAAFAPFDAGAERAVLRQGKKGTARRAHPSVGDASKVPGEGPPPPSLRLDPDLPERGAPSPNAIGAGLSANPLYLAALIYQHGITRLDGPRCAHLPTCSRFASQAVSRHGALGILMGLDRLIQPNESSALRKHPEVEGYGPVRGFDPVENYRVWESERFTGFPARTPEEPLALPPLTIPPTTTTATP